MKKEWWLGAGWSTSSHRVVEVLMGMKQTALVIDFSDGDDHELALYRPERGLLVSVDPRVPRPTELYRDVAYAQLFDYLGWDGVANVAPWSLTEDDRGVIRPFWRNSKKMEVYQFSRQNLEKMDFRLWKGVALADYVFGVGDRVSNDFLMADNDVWVVDSGFSFLSGLNFVCQQSIVRDLYRGEKVDALFLTDLERLWELDWSAIMDLLGEEEVYWVKERVGRVLVEEKFC